MNKLITVMQEHYGVEITHISPQQGGWAALAYKVSNDKHTYFLKVYEKSRASTPKWTALIDEYTPIMIWLQHNSGLRGKIPVPLLTKDGDYKCEDEDGVYLLYEYIDGETIGDKDLNREQARQLSDIITELHRYGEEIPRETAAIKEDFGVPFVKQLRNTLDKEYNTIAGDIREVLNPYIGQIMDLMDTVDKLSACLSNRHLAMTLCHTDIHYWNLMQSGQQLILIDWEGLKLAPVEADLMFLIDKPYYAEFLNIYQKVHSDFTIHPDTLRFYQGRRKLEDIWEWMEQLLYDNQTAEARANTLKSLIKSLKT